jgi:hypothetical protein
VAGGFSVGSVASVASIGAITSGSVGTQVTSSSTANTKGSWVQLTSGTPQDADWIDVGLNGFGVGPGVCAAVDIGIGPSGSEQVLLNNLVCYWNSGPGPSFPHFYLPLAIPAGTRVAARSQDNAGSNSVYVCMNLFQTGGGACGGHFASDTYGFVSTGATNGTVITASATSNTLGSWTSLGTLSTDIAGFLLAPDASIWSNNAANTYYSHWNFLINIGIGPSSGSVTTILPNLQVVNDQPLSYGFKADPDVLGYFPMQIPSGTQFWAQAQCSPGNGTNPSTTYTIGLTLYAVRL